MDPIIGFIIQNIPYLWLDNNNSMWGIQDWDKNRFSRIYLVPPNQTLYEGYLFPSKKNRSEYFRGTALNIKAKNYNDIRLNGNRVNLDNTLSHLYASSLPISVLYTHLDISFHKRDYSTFKLIKDYKTPTIVSPSIHILKTIFPPGLGHHLLKMTDVGLYSVTHWRETLHIVYEMEQFMKKDPKDLTITDATAGVGGDTLCFAQRFNRVNAVELDSLHCNIVDHNLSVYKQREKVRLVCANYIHVVEFYRPWAGVPLFQDVIYFDPPWGGPKYKTRRSVVLKLDNVPLSQIIWHILFHDLATYVFVKAPKNIELTYFPPHTCVKIRNFKLICIKAA